MKEKKQKEKLTKEWFIPTKWGRISMVSWGDRHLPGMLLVHGYQDTAATFLPLVSILPDAYHYVAFDLPGHGRSDHVETSQLIPLGFVVETIRAVIRHLQWKNFICMAHSMGFVIASLYNHLYPGRMTKIINIDPLVAVVTSYYMYEVPDFWYNWFYQYYYDHYHIYNGAPPRLFTREQLIATTMKARSVNREQAELLLTRSLEPAGNGLYRLSTQPIMRRILNLPAHIDSLAYILQHNMPPTLNLHATNNKSTEVEKAYVKKFLDFQNTKRTDLYFEAKHDLHITHAEELLPHIVEFLNKKFNSKL